MPAIYFFADEQDSQLVIDQINTDPEIAFIIPDGPLPLLTNHGSNAIIHNPFEGWTEESPGAEPLTPCFGPLHPAEIRLQPTRLRNQSRGSVRRICFGRGPRIVASASSARRRASA